MGRAILLVGEIGCVLGSSLLVVEVSDCFSSTRESRMDCDVVELVETR